MGDQDVEAVEVGPAVAAAAVMAAEAVREMEGLGEVVGVLAAEDLRCFQTVKDLLGPVALPGGSTMDGSRLTVWGGTEDALSS